MVRQAHHERNSENSLMHLKISSTPVRPEPVEACPELVEGGERFGKLILGKFPFMVRQAHHERRRISPRTEENLTTNGREKREEPWTCAIHRKRPSFATRSELFFARRCPHRSAARWNSASGWLRTTSSPGNAY